MRVFQAWIGAFGREIEDLFGGSGIWVGIWFQLVEVRRQTVSNRVTSDTNVQF